jgi:hypothetical protein
MEPKIWGPFMWFILHIISFNYPDTPSPFDKDAYRDFFNALKNVIPCDQCKKHYTRHLQDYPITPHLDSKKSLIEWMIQIHNLVNVSLNKKQFTTEEVLTIYETLEPISPFDIQATEQFKELKQTFISSKNNYDDDDFKKKNKCLFKIIIVLIIIIVILKCIHRKNYYDY